MSDQRRGTITLGREDGDTVTKPIPSSGERIPVIGIGTARERFRVGLPAEDVAMRKQVLQEFTSMGGRMLDVFRYGTAEILCGDLILELGNRDQFFIATKTSVDLAVLNGADRREAGMAQMNESFRRFNTDVIDLMQIANLTDWENQLPILREWKQEGRFRYIGVTVFRPDQHEALEAVMRQEELDFVQFDYSLEGRQAEDCLLPLAADRGMAVIINVPFRRGLVFQRLGERELPGWAAELGCQTMAQVTLKFIVSHPAVTCAIPGTDKMRYLLDNMGAAVGPMPDTTMRGTIAAWYDALPQVR
jgi:aryl-alcohol dehydrogenase-like predicted oxidoreductase